MIHNVILISLIIILIFFMSNETKINDVIMRNYIKYLLPLFIIYFVYQNYNLSILVIILLIIVFLNMNISDKLNNNSYFTKIRESFSNLPNLLNVENFSNVYDTNKLSFNLGENDTDKKTEPFKNEVNNIKELYQNIRNEMNQLLK